MRLHFLGANRQVTGSRYLLEVGGKRLLIDCGMFQERAYQDRNWEVPPFDPASIDALLLTHAHLDHCGLIPRLVKQGFGGPVYTHAASIDLATLIIEDAARIQVEDVEFKKRRHEREGRVSPHPYEPLYDPDDARQALRQFHPVQFGVPLQLSDQLRVTWHEAGHILGSAILEVVAHEGDKTTRIVFSGDLGQWHKPLIRDPSLLTQADYIIMESTYGDRAHNRGHSVEDQLAPIINDTVERGGNLVIPTFATERAQELLYHLDRLVSENRIPHVMAFLDSPMAVNATHVFSRYHHLLDEETEALLAKGDDPLSFPGLVLCRTIDQSKAINRVRGTAVIMAGSGMCTGGRVKHHLVRNLPRPESTVLFVGFQSPGTLGREIFESKPGDSVRIFNEAIPVRATIAQITGMSAHADQPALLHWLGAYQHPPRRLFLTHGEEGVSLQLAEEIRGKFGWTVDVPAYGQVVALSNC